MGVPVLIGHLAGDTAAGLLATLGAFTALYGNERPYRNRAFHLAAVALALTVSVMLGIQAKEIPWLVVPAVVLIATSSTFLCNALRIGPPGAYMFALACAAGTGLPIVHLSLGQAGLLVFGGGVFAWLAHMAGVLVQPRGPERFAVAAATRATARLLHGIGTPGEDAARHAAALALHQAWTVLVTWQPARPAADESLRRLRGLNRELHLLFADILNASAAGSAPPADAGDALRDIAARLRTIGGREADGRDENKADPAGTHPGEGADSGRIPLGHHDLRESLRESVRPWSPAWMATARVGAAAAIAGTLGILLGLERAYWAMAAAVLVLYQGLDWMRSLQRGIERMLGTLVGLALAGAILAIDPDGLWLVVTLMLLQFTIEMLVMRNYALAVVFITAVALTIASGAEPVSDPARLLLARGVDTVIGCVTGLLIMTVMSPRTVEIRIPRELVGVLVAVKRALARAASGDVDSAAARRARRELQHRAFALLQAYEAGMGAKPWHRAQAERSWPTVVATQRLAYRVLTFCWMLEKSVDDRAAIVHASFGPGGERQIGRALLQLARAVHAGTGPAPLASLPEFLRAELRLLHDSLVTADTIPNNTAG